MRFAAYYEAAIPEPATILGLKLRPLSLGHLILLNRVESSFVVGGVPDFDDLALSVLICSLSYLEGIEALDDPDLSEFMRLWHRKLTWRGWFKRRQPINLAEKCEQFRRYVETASNYPDFSCHSDGREIRAPLVQVVRVRLLSSMHCTEDEILNRPWGLCLWDYMTLLDLEGSIELVDSQELNEAQEKAAKLLRQIQPEAN